MKRPELTQAERAEICRRYLYRQSTKEIAAAMDCCTETVLRILKKEGVWKRDESLHDSADQIRMCLKCRKKECNNCIGEREERRKHGSTKKDRK